MERKKNTEVTDGTHTIPIREVDIEKLHSMYSPEYIDITTLTDSTRRYITTTNPGTSITYSGETVYYPAMTFEPRSYLTGETFRAPVECPKDPKEVKDFICKTEKIKKKDFPKMKVERRKEPEYMGDRCRVVCDNEQDLTQDNILKNLSVVKSRLFLESAPSRLFKIECKMTPAVKQNIIMAYRKTNMYGKDIPFIPCFDEYGRRLDDRVNLDTLQGMTVNIVDPEEYGELYLEFNGIMENTFDFPF